MMFGMLRLKLSGPTKLWFMIISIVLIPTIGSSKDLGKRPCPLFDKKNLKGMSEESFIQEFGKLEFMQRTVPYGDKIKRELTVRNVKECGRIVVIVSSVKILSNQSNDNKITDKLVVEDMKKGDRLSVACYKKHNEKRFGLGLITNENDTLKPRHAEDYGEPRPVDPYKVWEINTRNLTLEMVPDPKSFECY